jgi:hypothetical protein
VAVSLESMVRSGQKVAKKLEMKVAMKAEVTGDD